MVTFFQATIVLVTFVLPEQMLDITDLILKKKFALCALDNPELYQVTGHRSHTCPSDIWTQYFRHFLRSFYACP